MFAPSNVSYLPKARFLVKNVSSFPSNLIFYLRPLICIVYDSDQGRIVKETDFTLELWGPSEDNKLSEKYCTSEQNYT